MLSLKTPWESFTVSARCLVPSHELLSQCYLSSETRHFPLPPVHTLENGFPEKAVGMAPPSGQCCLLLPQSSSLASLLFSEQGCQDLRPGDVALFHICSFPSCSIPALGKVIAIYICPFCLLWSSLYSL